MKQRLRSLMNLSCVVAIPLLLVLASHVLGVCEQKCKTLNPAKDPNTWGWGYSQWLQKTPPFFGPGYVLEEFEHPHCARCDGATQKGWCDECDGGTCDKDGDKETMAYRKSSATQQRK